MIEQRDLLLVPFPFSDQSGKKVRPVIVVGNNEFNDLSGDVVVIGVTSNITKDSYTVLLENKDLEEGKLMDLCCVKVENVLKLDKGLVIKKIGKISVEKFKEILSVLDAIIK
ncbi:MAG: type II toxin-antitoxin system PemK/MazF family toxin [Candidatus Woesearchaeota archaeon]